jgi:hypothetical protein
MKIQVEVFDTEKRPLRQPTPERTHYTIAQVKFNDPDGVTVGPCTISEDLLKENGGELKPAIYDAHITLQPDGFRTQVIIKSLTPVKASPQVQPVRQAATA